MSKVCNLKVTKRIIVGLLLCMLFVNGTSSIYAEEITNNDSNINKNHVNEKVDSELQVIMDKVDENELINIWLWLDSINEAVVNQKMIDEQNMDPDIYENPEKFNEMRLPKIEKMLEEDLGYDVAHSVMYDNFEFSSNYNSLLDVIEQNTNKTPIEQAVFDEYQAYVEAKRGIKKRLQGEANNLFINNYVKQFGRREIIYNGTYTSTLIIEATKNEIQYYSQLDCVESISLYQKEVLYDATDVVLEQVGVYSSQGTGLDAPNWLGMNGFGIKVGIIENYCCDTNIRQLSNNDKLHVIPYDADSTYETDNHATLVTSIIAGKDVTYASEKYRGVVPAATVYQMALLGSGSIPDAVSKLVELGVNVINISMGFMNGTGYDNCSKEIDRIVADTGVVVVCAAGNPELTVGSPSKGYNVITVGTAVTVDQNYLPINGLYAIGATSAYQEDNYLPNKPDVVAPGVNISVVVGEKKLLGGSGNSFAAPIITGIIAQMMQEDSRLISNPTAVKAALVLGANHDLLNTSDDTLINYGIRDKSGAGFVDARYALNRLIDSRRVTIDLEAGENATENIYLEAGTRIRAVMAVGKENNILVTCNDETDDLDFILRSADTGRMVECAMSGRNNVEIIDYEVVTSGNYSLEVDTFRVADSENIPKVSIAYRVFE